ncbi:MAG: thioredoxin family protein [Desulfobacterales bacterium]|nr:thioredoxin family protein [Desulfobacterales bacterium]
MKMKSIAGGFIILIFIFLFSGFSFNIARADDIKWHSYNEGMTLRNKEKKKLFLFFTAEWCSYCTKMVSHTFKDGKVITCINKNFIPVKVDFDRENKIASSYQVRGLPSIWFVAENGEKISNLPGYIPPDKLFSIIKYIYTDSYKQMSFQKFVEKNEK